MWTYCAFIYVYGKAVLRIRSLEKHNRVMKSFSLGVRQSEVQCGQGDVKHRPTPQPPPP